MKVKKLIIIIILVIIAIFFGRKLLYRSDFELDSKDKYIVTTSEKFMTMQNDGGSHTSTYYQVDLGKKKVYKCRDSYKGFEGYKTKGKIVNRKVLNDDEVVQLRNLFNKVIDDNTTEMEVSSMLSGKSYTVSTLGYDLLYINDETTIDELNNLLE